LNGLLSNPLVLQSLALAGKIIFIMTVVMSAGAILSWVERKQSAILQDRIGANRADIFGFTALGLFHILSDGIKGITKEDYVPPSANKFLHTLAPFLSCFTALACFAVLPFGDQVQIPGLKEPVVLTIAPLEVGLLFVFAMLSIGVYGVVLAGYVSNNKFSTLGALRASAQVLSYEITLGLTIMGVLLLYRSLDLRQIILAQQSGNWWGVVTQPLGFLLFMSAAIVEIKRVPFDLPEGESEIIGYFLEYSGMKFLLFLMAEFIETVLFAWIIVALFFGGWDVPGLHLAAAGQAGGFFLGGSLVWSMAPWTVVAVQALAFAGKIVFFCWLMMQIRWTLPRFRYDQMMRLGWKIMLPLSLANLVVTAVIAYWNAHG
jgi:NADH-quinone oxidoreductase subunit H